MRPTQKPVIFLYTSKEQMETVKNKTLKITLKIKRTIKHLSIHLTKHVVVYVYVSMRAKHHKMLMKELKENLNQWRDVPCFGLEKLITLKIRILPRLIYRCNEIAIKASAGIL